jgi:hypothetical protein
VTDGFYAKPGLGAGAHDSGLQPLHVVDAAEDLILERSVVSRVVATWPLPITKPVPA